MNTPQQELEHRAVEAMRAAKAAGRVIMSCYNKPDLQINNKSSHEYVTEADLKADAKILELLKRAFPNDTFITEETFKPGQTIDLTSTWIIDPIDGTTNYTSKLPMFAVSIAYVQNGQLKIGLIFNPATKQTYLGVAGKPATLNGKVIHVNTADNLGMGLVTVPFTLPLKTFKSHVKPRKLGASSIEMANVATGTLLGTVYRSIKPWDIAAGIMLVECAGGKVTDFKGNPIDLSKPQTSLIASNGKVHQEFMDAVSMLKTP